MAQDSNSTQNELLLKKIQQMEGEHNNENEKGLKKQYKKLEKALEQYPDEKESPFLESILNKALAQNLEIEEQIQILKQWKQDKKVNKDQNEQLRQVQIKSALEQECRIHQKNLQIIAESRQKMNDEETKKRQEMQDHFTKAHDEISSKVQQQEEEYQTKKAENVILTQQLNDLIKSFEGAENQFIEKMTKKDEERRLKSQEFLQKIQVIQAQAQEAQERRKVLEELQRELNEKKMNLVIYGNKQNDYVENIDRSVQGVSQLKEELFKLCKRLQDSEQKQQANKYRLDESNAGLIKMMEINDKLKSQIEGKKDQKNQIKESILKVQNQLKVQQANK